MNKEIKSFTQYLKENEEVDMNRPLKGYTADQIIERISNLMELLSDDVRFGVPSDNIGRATTYRDANGAIQKIKDMQHYYDGKNEPVRFYCWSISYNGSWKATQSLRKKIEGAGGFGEENLNMNLKKVLDYFTQNPEDSDNVRSISISMDSISIRKAMNTKSGEVAAPEKEEIEKSTKPIESTDSSTEVAKEQ